MITPDSQVRRVATLLRKKQSERFFGRIVLCLENGNLIVAKVEETLRAGDMPDGEQEDEDEAPQSLAQLPPQDRNTTVASSA